MEEYTRVEAKNEIRFYNKVYKCPVTDSFFNLKHAEKYLFLLSIYWGKRIMIEGIIRKMDKRYYPVYTINIC